MPPVEKGTVVHVNSATLIMGVTGSGKSSLLATLARYVWETYHHITVICSSDGGGIPTDVQALMQKGLIWFWRMRTRDLPDGSLSFETCARATQGWLPKRLDRRTGQCFPGEPLLPPITERYAMHCPNGHAVKTVPFSSMLLPSMCPQCRVMVDRSNMQVTKTAERTKGFEQIGAVCFDGLTSMLSWNMSDMGQRAGRLELKGEEGAIGGKINSGDMKFGGSSRSHYGFAQGRAEDMVLNSLAIPYLDVPPIFTALTLETDDEADLRIRGPKLAGRAKTDEAPAWFGNTLETIVHKSDKDERIYRLCLSEFVDDGGVRHLCKNRAAPGTMPAFLEDPPLKVGHEKETAFTAFNLGVFFTLLNDALVQSVKDADALYPDAPGLPEGIAEVGEVGSATVPAPAGMRPAGSQPVASPSTTSTGAPATASQVGRPPVVPPVRPGAPRGPVARPAPVRPAAAPHSTTQAASAPVPQVPPPATSAAPEAPPAPAPVPIHGVEGVTPETAPPPPMASATPSTAGATPRWAPPAAPRPPAPAPRVGARK